MQDIIGLLNISYPILPFLSVSLCSPKIPYLASTLKFDIDFLKLIVYFNIIKFTFKETKLTL